MLRDRISRLCAWCQSVIPLTDWNSLSVWEALCKVIAKLNEVIETVNKNSSELQAVLDTLAGDIDGLTANLKKYIDEQAAKVLSDSEAYAKEYADGRYAQSVLDNNALEAKLTDIINKQVYALSVAISQGDMGTKLYVDAELIKMREEIAGLQQKLPLITNPFTGKLDTISNTMRDLVNAFSYHAFTAGEWDAYGLTAREADGYNMSAIDYQIWAKCKTGWYEWKLGNYFKMPDPWTGEFVKVQTVIAKLAVLHMLGYTAGELDALDLTAQEYDTYAGGSPVTAYNFNWTDWQMS